MSPARCATLARVGLSDELRAIADETDFSGVVVISRAGEQLGELSRGWAHRAHRIENALETRFGIASGTKGLTALTTVALVEYGDLGFDTTLTSLIGDALPLVDPAVTIEQLLGHTSGVGDYLDEEEEGDVEDRVLRCSADELETPADYLPHLDGHPQKSVPGERFAYNNSGYVMLSIAVEAATGHSFYDLVHDLVLEPAGMVDTDFLRSDELPNGAAAGYLRNGRSNIFHLPVRGAGDGGVYSTAGDMKRLWSALFEGRIVSPELVESMVDPRHDASADGLRYGLGFWLRPDRPTVMLEGMDAGVSFRSAHDRPSGLTYTVISNTSSGAWPLVRLLDERLPELAE